MKLLIFVITCYLATAFAIPRRNEVLINDPDGNCWLCSPTAPCRPCNENRISGRPTPIAIPFDPKCPVPTCTIDNIDMTWPVNEDPTMFWKCGTANGQLVPVKMDCQCGTYYYWKNQRCEFPWDTPELCDQIINNPPIKPPRVCPETPRPIVPQFNGACPVPECTGINLELLFPVNEDPTKFYQCGSVNGQVAPVALDCQCGTYFNWYTQRCEHPWDTTNLCASQGGSPPAPRPCDENEPTATPTFPTAPTPGPTDPTPTPSIPPTWPPCQPCIPWWPCICPCNGQTSCGCNGGSTCTSRFF